MMKTIVVTGVSKGLGRALAEKFIDLGHTVIGCARSASAIANLQKKYPQHHFTAVDVADEQQVKNWAESFLSEYNPDFVINNAAIINQPNVFWEIPAADFSNLIDINIKGTANVLRHVIPTMVERNKGIIVNFSSGWGRSTSPEVSSYCASKWAIEGLTRALAQELPSGMAAIPLNPGVIHTDMLDICFGDEAQNYTSIDEWVEIAAPFILNFSRKDNGEPKTVFA